MEAGLRRGDVPSWLKQNLNRIYNDSYKILLEKYKKWRTVYQCSPESRVRLMKPFTFDKNVTKELVLQLHLLKVTQGIMWKDVVLFVKDMKLNLYGYHIKTLVKKSSQFCRSKDLNQYFDASFKLFSPESLALFRKRQRDPCTPGRSCEEDDEEPKTKTRKLEINTSSGQLSIENQERLHFHDAGNVNDESRADLLNMESETRKEERISKRSQKSSSSKATSIKIPSNVSKKMEDIRSHFTTVKTVATIHKNQKMSRQETLSKPDHFKEKCEPLKERHVTENISNTVHKEQRTGSVKCEINKNKNMITNSAPVNISVRIQKNLSDNPDEITHLGTVVLKDDIINLDKMDNKSQSEKVTSSSRKSLKNQDSPKAPSEIPSAANESPSKSPVQGTATMSCSIKVSPEKNSPRKRIGNQSSVKKISFSSPNSKTFPHEPYKSNKGRHNTFSFARHQIPKKHRNPVVSLKRLSAREIKRWKWKAKSKSPKFSTLKFLEFISPKKLTKSNNALEESFDVHSGISEDEQVVKKVQNNSVMSDKLLSNPPSKSMCEKIYGSPNKTEKSQSRKSTLSRDTIQKNKTSSDENTSGTNSKSRTYFPDDLKLGDSSFQGNGTEDTIVEHKTKQSLGDDFTHGEESCGDLFHQESNVGLEQSHSRESSPHKIHSPKMENLKSFGVTGAMLENTDKLVGHLFLYPKHIVLTNVMGLELNQYRRIHGKTWKAFLSWVSILSYSTTNHYTESQLRKRLQKFSRKYGDCPKENSGFLQGDFLKTLDTIMINNYAESESQKKKCLNVETSVGLNNEGTDDHHDTASPRIPILVESPVSFNHEGFEMKALKRKKLEDPCKTPTNRFKHKPAVEGNDSKILPGEERHDPSDTVSKNGETSSESSTDRFTSSKLESQTSSIIQEDHVCARYPHTDSVSKDIGISDQSNDFEERSKDIPMDKPDGSKEADESGVILTEKSVVGDDGDCAGTSEIGRSLVIALTDDADTDDSACFFSDDPDDDDDPASRKMSNNLPSHSDSASVIEHTSVFINSTTPEPKKKVTENSPAVVGGDEPGMKSVNNDKTEKSNEVDGGKIGNTDITTECGALNNRDNEKGTTSKCVSVESRPCDYSEKDVNICVNVINNMTDDEDRVLDQTVQENTQNNENIDKLEINADALHSGSVENKGDENNDNDSYFENLKKTGRKERDVSVCGNKVNSQLEMFSSLESSLNKNKMSETPDGEEKIKTESDSKTCGCKCGSKVDTRSVFSPGRKKTGPYKTKRAFSFPLPRETWDRRQGVRRFTHTQTRLGESGNITPIRGLGGKILFSRGSNCMRRPLWSTEVPRGKRVLSVSNQEGLRPRCRENITIGHLSKTPSSTLMRGTEVGSNLLSNTFDSKNKNSTTGEKNIEEIPLSPISSSSVIKTKDDISAEVNKISTVSFEEGKNPAQRNFDDSNNCNVDSEEETISITLVGKVSEIAERLGSKYVEQPYIPKILENDEHDAPDKQLVMKSNVLEQPVSSSEQMCKVNVTERGKQKRSVHFNNIVSYGEISNLPSESQERICENNQRSTLSTTSGIMSTEFSRSPPQRITPEDINRELDKGQTSKEYSSPGLDSRSPEFHRSKKRNSSAPSHIEYEATLIPSKRFKKTENHRGSNNARPQIPKQFQLLNSSEQVTQSSPKFRKIRLSPVSTRCVLNNSSSDQRQISSTEWIRFIGQEKCDGGKSGKKKLVDATSQTRHSFFPGNDEMEESLKKSIKSDKSQKSSNQKAEKCVTFQMCSDSTSRLQNPDTPDTISDIFHFMETKLKYLIDKSRNKQALGQGSAKDNVKV